MLTECLFHTLCQAVGMWLWVRPRVSPCTHGTENLRLKVCVGKGKKETQLIYMIISTNKATMKRNAIFIRSQGTPHCGCDIWADPWRRRRENLSHTWGEEEHHIESKSQNTKAPKQEKRPGVFEKALAHGDGRQLLLLTFKIILGCKWPCSFALSAHSRTLTS